MSVRLFRVTCYGLLLISVLSYTLRVESSITRAPKVDTIHLFPGVVESEAWVHDADLLVRDVTEDGIYQEFNRTNSVQLLPLERVSNTDSMQLEALDEGAEENVYEEMPLDADTEDLTPLESDAIEEDDVVESNEGAQVDSDDNADPVQLEEDEAVEPEETSAETSEVPAGSYISARDAIFGFFARVTDTFLFAQESVVEEISEVPADAEVTEVVVNDAMVLPSVTHEQHDEYGEHTHDEALPTEVHTGVHTDDASPSHDRVVDTYRIEELIASTTADEREEMTHEDAIQTEERSDAYPIEFTDFSIPPLSSGQFIMNVQLRMSLGAQYEMESDSELPLLAVEYTFGDTWTNAGEIILTDEVSNALNGGYFLFALPQITDPSVFDDLRVRVSYVGDRVNLKHVYVDSLWLEFDTETIDRDVLSARLVPEQLSYSKLPDMHELISAELDFGRTEQPKFVLRYEPQRNVVVQFFRNIFSKHLAEIQEIAFVREDAGAVLVSPEITMTDDGLWTIQMDEEDTEKLQPGTYTVELVVAEGGKTYTDTFNFQWGMLAVNPDQTEYSVGDAVTVSLAALSPDGNTICDASLSLYIIDPNEYISEAQVYNSGLCNGNNVIDAPDYISQFIVETPGTYEMYVEHTGEDGEVRSHTSDTFIVSETQDVWIERVGPTRIYPPALYPMQITVHTEVSLTGVLTERVPNTFVVRDTDAQIQEIDGMFELSWNLDMAASSSKEFSYSFDAPDISPYLYTLGPAQIVSDEANIVVDEILPTANEMLLTETIITDLEGEVVVPIVVSEEVAPDAVPTESAVVHEVDIVSEESTLEEETAPLLGAVEVPVEEVVEEPSLIEAIVDFVFGDDTSPTDNEEVIETVAPGDADSISPGEGIVPEEVPVTDEVTVPVEMNASTTTPVVTDAKGFKEHRKWQIASDATGSMLLYWASTTIPTGWTCVSCGPSDAFYQRFVLGSSTPGVNGGASTHSHSATGGVTASGASTNINGGGGSNVPTVGHAHTYTPTISTDSNLPAYRELVLIQHNSAGSPSSIPANAIALFDDTLPSGWDVYTPQNGLYIRSLGTTTIGSTGGSNTHSHTISGNLTATGNFTTAAAGDNLVDTATAAHTHSINTFTDTVNHEPPYREAILGKLSATTTTPTDAMIAMWTDTPPNGWATVSSSTEAFAGRMVKPSATYGATGGSATTTHADTTGITSGAPSGTQTRDLVTIDRTVTTDIHTHTVDVTNYTVVTTLPPYRTAIFAKRAPGGASPNAPTIHALFDNENTGTSSPRFEFTGDDPDGADTLVYQFEWDDDKDVGSSPLGSRTSDDESGCSPDCFTNTASSSDTHPFTDNERIRFIPPSALTSGVTYYFRVRVKETVGDTWSDWSSVYSSTIESGVTLSEWLQTQGSQFEGGALTNAATTTSDVQVSSTTLTFVPTVESGWRSNTATGSATLVLTKPTGVEVGDLLLILVGNDANNATVQWDDISLRPSGFTNINEAGNATPDTHVGAFYRIADGTEGATSSVPAATSANFWGFYIRVTGASTTNPINAVGSDYAVNNLTNHPIPSVNTTLPNTLAFYMLAGDAVGTAPFSVAGAGWSESDEKTVNTAGTWGTRSMTSAGATGAATVTMNASDGASGFQFAINPASPFATVQSPEIDFDTVSGQTRWGEIEWSATEPSQTSAILRVYYTSTSTCDSLVPDSVLSGNSTGFDAASSPILIANLSTTTYNRICLKETLSMDGGGSSPTLDEWTVRWVRTPQFTQTDYIWYANTNSSTPSDIWPVGATDLEENEPIDSSIAVLTSDILRLRMSVTATSSVVSTSSISFKLQYAEGDVCSADLSWYDVGAVSSTTALWRGYNNAGPSDGATLDSPLLLNTTVRESYEEENDTTLNPGGIPIGGIAEWDFALQNYAGTPGAAYCFRMVTPEGSRLNSYTNYPIVTTNASPNTIRLFSPFDNEKIASTTPFFEFDGIDTESNDITFQIQIDDDYTFGSVNIDRDTVSNPTLFENLVTPADKDPYTNGETIRFTPSSALTNGVTYYWRVRGKDPLGSNDWGAWSTISSLTVDTSVTVSTWYQTTEEQFDTNTHERTDAIATDLVQLAVGSTTGTTTSSAINFLDGSQGNAWGSLSWTDNETSSDIKYRLQYYDGVNDVWDFIPEADLVGNTAGFDTSPISLLDLNVDTYEVIRVVALLTNSGASPTLSEWTVAWGYRIEVPTINAPFRNEKVSTTTPTFEFYTTDPQNDSLVYEVQWSASSTFAASTTRMSSSSVGFVNLVNGGDASPFTSGDTIQFTIQTADALVNGRTYWWRVRATDPLGSGQYSFYSDEQSFTVDTSVTVSTWFQTTAEQFNTDTLSGTVVTGTSSVTIATTSVESLIAYAEGSLTVPKYRLWDGTQWGTEQSALDVGAAIGWVVTKAAPDTNEYIMATQGTDADVNVQVYANGSWDNMQEITTTIPNTNMRGFDVAYEQQSGDAIAVTCDGDAIASYWVWDGSAWTNGGSVGSVLNNTCGWVKLVSDPTSDEIIAVLRGTTGTRYEARVWDGSAWGNSATLGSMNQTTHEGIAASYEDSGNQAVVIASNGTAASYNWRAWNGATWTATATVALGDDFEAGTLSSDDGTDNMAFCYVDEDGDIGVQRWTGAGFAAGTVEFSTAWVTAGNIYNDRPVDCIFETKSGRDGYITGVFSTTTAMASTTWTGAAWSTNRKISTFGPSGVRVQLSRTGDGIIQAVSYASTTDRYEFSYWNGSAWSALQILEADGAAGATPYKEPFMIAPKNPVTTGSVVGDPVGIDFYAGSGPYWQQMSWNDTESGGSSILYQVEYYDGDSWELIPNAYIPGNSTGTSTSPINLANVLPVSTFNLIRPVATFTCNLGTCPVLADWTITWSAGITISGTAQQFDESSNVTSGTVAVALNGVLQTGKTGTISGGTWSIANVNASPGDVVTVFVNGANDLNEAVGLARYDGVGDLSGMRLYEQHVTLGSNDATTTPFTNSSFAFYDFTNDEDIFFNATGTSLSLCVDVGCANAELYVMASSTLTMSDTFTFPSLHNNGTVNLGGYTVYVSRSWDNNATVTAATSSVVFTATSTTETIDETGATSPAFYNLTFGTTTGAATWNLVSPLDVNGALTVTRGTLSRGTTSISVAGALTNGANGTWVGMGTTTFDGTGTSNWTDSNGTLQNIGRVLIDGTSKTVQLASAVTAQSIYIGADDIFDVSTLHHGITVLSDWINTNTFVARNGTVTFGATTTNRTITAGGDAFYNLSFSGAGGSWSFTEADLSVGNNLTIATGTVTLSTGTTTITGSFSSAGGTFAHNNATVLMNASTAKTITASGTPFTNAFYNLRFTGSGSWSFVDTSATTTNDFTITQGSVTLPGTMVTVGGNFINSAGTFVHNSGTVKLSAASARVIDTNSSFNSLSFTGSGSWSFMDANVTALGSVTVSSGTVTLPSGTLTIGGSFTNSATTTHNSGTVLFNSTDVGETISLGSSTLSHMTFNSGTGGWTIISNATTTGSTTLTAVGSFTLNPSQVLSVGGVFTNSVGGASTTWTGSTLSIESGSSTINTKTNTGDVYGTLRVKANTDVRMWNSSSTVYEVDATGSLYSQDHSGVDGALYIFGAYERLSGTEYWNYETDFDGTALSTSTARQANIRFDAGASASFATGTVVQVLGTSTATTSIDKIASGFYGVNASSVTINASYYQFKGLNATGFSINGSSTITSLAHGDFEVSAASGTAMTVSSTTIDANARLPIYYVNFTTTLSTSTPSDWLAGWDYRKTHALTAAGGAGTNYQMKITLHYGAGTDSGTDVYLNGKSKVDFGDVRFTTNSGTTLIDHWVASSTSATVAEVWVEIPADLSSANQTIYVYYGNASASYPFLGSERAHGDATFLFFDDFSVDLSRWQREVVTGVYPQIATTTSPYYVRNGGGITSGLYGFTSLGSNPTYTGFNNNAVGFKARNATDAIGSVAFRGSATTTNTGYQARFDQRAAQGHSFLRPPYSGWNFLSGCAVDTNRPTVDTWYIYDITASTSDFKFYRNGTLMKSCSDATYTTPGQISLQNHYGSYTDYDWVFVRKFQGTEPGHGSWGTEEIISLSSGTNVTAIGTSTTYWRFWEHTGALSGEGYDTDPGGNPGYIRWDDSALTIAVSGTVYSDDGVTTMGAPTCNGVTANVTVVVNPGVATSTWCSPTTGAYSISVPIVGDVTLTTYLDTNGGQKGVVVTKTPTEDIVNHHIYANRVITKHEDVLPLTIADMASFDSTDDSDIPFTAASGTTHTLVLPFNTELHIASSTTFAPGGNITIYGNGSSTSQDGSLHIDDNGTLTGSATSTYTLAGSFTMDVGATFIPASTTVIMNATTTGKTITTTTGQEISFNNLQFTGVNGGWNINGNIRVLGNVDVATGTVTGTGNVTIPYGSFSGNGTLSLGSGTTTIERTNTLGGTTAWTFGNLVLGNGSVVGTTTPATNATTTVLGTLTISNAHYLNAHGSGWNLRGAGTAFVASGTFIRGTSTVQYSSTANANILSTNYYNLSFDAFGGTPTYTATGIGILVENNLTVGTTNATNVTFDTNDTALDVGGTVTIHTNGVLTGSNSGAFTVAGSWANTGSFVHSSGRVVFDSSALGNIVSPGGSPFYDVDFDSASGGWTVGPSLRADRNLSILNAQSFIASTSPSMSGASWYDTSWSYRKAITIDHTKVGSTSTSTLVDFPVLVSTTNASFKYTGNGGNVGKSNGGDILFTSSDGTTKLSHEIEKYSSTTGEVIAWVRVPVLATSTDTELYIYYGNSSASDQWNITGTWNDGGSNYFKGVYHMKEATSTNPADSSPAGNNGTQINAPSQTTGQIDGALLLNGTNQNIDTTYTQTNVTSYTVGAWVKTTDAGIQRAIVQNRGSGAGQSLTLGIGTTGGGHGGAGRVGFELDSNTIDIGISSVASIHDDNWHYVVGTWGAATGTAVHVSQFKIYIDGALAATTSGSTGSASSPLTGLSGAKIGRHESWATYLAGTIDEVRMATVVRSLDWIKTEYNNQSAPSTFATFGSETSSGSLIEVRGTFTNAVGDTETTWDGSTLYINSGTTQSINTKTSGGDVYDTLRVGPSTQVRMWNSSAGTTSPTSTASVYSQDHGGVDGSLYVYGAYTKTTGTDYWNYATDFDGVSLGGGARKVDVYFASSSSATYTGGGLQLLGTPSASTTVQNQGSGTFGLTIGGTASTSMSYYEFEHMNASGLTFSGTPQVTTLSYGDYIVSVNGGSAITVGGTAINQNPAKTFTNNSFATSSGVSAFNVTATGTSVSSWRFTNHTGTIDGEAYDVDPDGDPGYVVWDDSATSIAFSGRVYSDEGTAVSTVCDSSTQNIVLRIAGLTTYTTSCNGDGFGGGTGLYTFTGISYSPGDSLVVFIDGEAQKAAVVTEDPLSNINNLDLYENRVIVRHEGTDPLSIADMALWDSSDDADIPFTAVDAGTDTLTLPSNTKLIVWTGKEFEPMGNVTVTGGGGGAAYDGTLELQTNAIFDATGSETHTVGGSFISGSGAVIDDETSTFVFTTTGSARTIDTNEYSFNNLTLNGSGSWIISNSTLEVGNDLTIMQGTLTLPSGTSTIAGSFLNTGGSFVQNGGRMYFTSTGAESIRIGGGAFGTTTFNGVGGSWTYLGTHATTTGDFTVVAGTVTAATGTLTVGGDFVNQGTFTHNSGTLRFTSGKASTTVTTSGSDLGSTTFAGSGSFVFTTTNVAQQGTLTILQGTVRLATGTHSIGGSLRNTGGSFVHSTGTVLFNSSDTGEVIDAGGSLFTNITIAAPTGGYTITNSATATADFALTSAASFTQNSGTTLAVGEVFTNLVGGGATTWTGSTVRLYSGLEYSINTSGTGGDAYNTFLLDANTDIRMWNSSATVVLQDTQSSLYSQDNAGVNGELYIYGNYVRTTGTDYWSYATDFDGTSLTGVERAVTVRHASGATSTFTGGTLSIVGSSVGTTTITNQGSGTYSWNVTGGTLQAQQYAVRNTDASGLVLSGETTVTSLSNGDFELAVNGGTLMTISSTTINYNASMVIAGMRFATTTAITGVNGAVVGTTLSAWTFTSHRGNLAGESFDDDGVDDCGSLRWSDSSCLITQQSAYRWRNDDGGEGVPSSEWYDTDWTKRTRVNVENNDATVYANAVVEVTVPYDSDMQSDFDDIRFTGDDGVTPLDFVREVYTASTDATFWVEVPSLAASAVTAIYAYYGNGSIAYGGVGTTTFSMYDDFEDNTITEYSGDTSLFNSDTAFAYQGSYGLEATNPNDRTTDGIFRTDMSVSQGETIRYFQYIDTSSGSGDETCTLFGVQTPGTNNNNYAVCLEQFGVDRVSLVKDARDNDTNATMLASTTITYTTGWYEVEIDWDTDDSIYVSVYDDNTLVATTTATDSSYTTGGIGFAFWFQHGGWDLYSARTLMTTDPTVTLGFEQVSGGATWIAALNTPAQGVSVNTTIRPRFLIENTGLSVSDAYQLEYAAKGLSPSCEAVSPASYTAVPDQSSCTGSPICMETSTQFTNNASTTDILGGEGTFTYGQSIEDPDNTTQSLVVGPNRYTEVEYAITLTDDAADSSYCLRVSDVGTNLDSYVRVAELGLIFIPNITSLVFNNGLDISLISGTTTRIYATGTVTDLNGYTDIETATTTFYQNGLAGGVGYSCTPDNNNCYRMTGSQCSFTNCSGNSCDVVCYADMYYHTNPTDTGSTYAADAWTAFLDVSDQSGEIATTTSVSVDLLTLRAIAVDSTIDYGALEVNSDTGSYNATTTVQNIGNDALDISVEGTDLTDGGSSQIPVAEQIFATSTFTYTACTVCSALSTSATSYELDLAKPASTTPSIADQLFWGIAVPFGVAGTAHSGTNTFYAIGD